MACVLVVCYVACRLVEEGVLVPQADIEVPEIPMDLASAVKLKKVGAVGTLGLLRGLYQANLTRAQ